MTETAQERIAVVACSASQFEFRIGLATQDYGSKVSTAPDGVSRVSASLEAEFQTSLCLLQLLGFSRNTRSGPFANSGSHRGIRCATRRNTLHRQRIECRLGFGTRMNQGTTDFLLELCHACAICLALACVLNGHSPLAPAHSSVPPRVQSRCRSIRPERRSRDTRAKSARPEHLQPIDRAGQSHSGQCFA